MATYAVPPVPIADQTQRQFGTFIAMNTTNSTSPSSYGHLSGKNIKAASIKWATKEAGPSVKFTTVQAYEAAGIPLPAPKVKEGEAGAGEAGAAGAAGAGAPAAGGGQAAPVAVAALAVAAVLGRARSRSRAGRRAAAAANENEEDWRADAAAGAAGAPVLGLRRGRAAAGRPPAGPAAAAAAQAAPAAAAAGGAAPAAPAAAAAGAAAAQPAAVAAPAGGAAAPAAEEPAGLAENPAATAWQSNLSSIPGGSLLSWEEDRVKVVSSAYAAKRDKVWRRTAGVRVPTQAERLAAIGRAPAGYKGKKGKAKAAAGDGDGDEDEDGSAAEDEEEGENSPAQRSARERDNDEHAGVKVNAGRMRSLLSTLVIPRAMVLSQENSLLSTGAVSSRAGCLSSYQLIPKNSEEYPEPSELARQAWEAKQLAAMRAETAAREAALGLDGTLAQVTSFPARRAKELTARLKGTTLPPTAAATAFSGITYNVGSTSMPTAGAMPVPDPKESKKGVEDLASAYGGKAAGTPKASAADASMGLAGDRLPSFLEGLPESVLAGYPAHVREYVRSKVAAAGKQKAAARQADTWIAALEGAEDGPAGAAGFAPAVLARRLAEIASIDARPNVVPQDIGMDPSDQVGRGVASRGLTGVHAMARPKLVAPIRDVLPPRDAAPAVPWPVPGSLAATLATNPRLAAKHAKKVEKDKSKGKGSGRAASAGEPGLELEQAL